MSAELQWAIVRKNNRFLNKNLCGAREEIDTHPLNVSGKNSFSSNGLVNSKAVGVSAGAKSGVVFTVKRPSKTRNPKSTTAQVKLFRGARPTYASIRSQTAGNYYRGDLTQVAIAKASAILRSQRGKKLKSHTQKGRKGRSMAAMIEAKVWDKEE